MGEVRSKQAHIDEALVLLPPSRVEVELALIRRLGLSVGVDPEQIRQAATPAHGRQDLNFTPSFSAHVRMDVSEEERVYRTLIEY